jgi:Ran GTPase-activating protein (RanGAP) involved in mRNA processing and transport
MNDHWTKLRTLLSCQPHHRIWGALVRVLEDWPAGELEAALTEAEAVLVSWPDMLRAGDAWLPALLAGQPQPRFRLARRLSFLTSAPEQLARALALPELAPLTALDVGYLGEGAAEIIRIVARSPVLRRVRSFEVHGISLAQGELEVLLEAGALASVQELSLAGCGLEAAHLRKLVESLSGGPLRSLNLSYNPLGDDGTQVLAGWPGARALRQLVLEKCKVGTEGAAALGSSPHLGALEELTVGADPAWGEAGLRRFLQSFQLLQLRKLQLQAHELGDAGAQALAACAGLAKLESLDLRGNGIGPKGCQALAQSPHLESLSALSLGDNPLGIKGLTALASSPLLGRLRDLSLIRVKAGAKGAAALAASPQSAGLRHLNLMYNDIKDEGVTALVQSPHLAGLRQLSLFSNKIGPAGAAALARARWSELRELDFGGNPLGGAGGKALAEGAGLAPVAVLQLSHCRLGNAGLADLLGSPHLRQVERIDLASNSVRRPGLEALVRAAEQLPRLMVLDLSGNNLTPDELAVLLQSRALTEAALAGGHHSLRELAAPKPASLSLEQAQTFFEEFLRREHAMQVAKYRDTPEGFSAKQAALRQLCGLGYISSITHQGGIGEEARERQAQWEVMRPLFLIRAFQHPALGTLFRAYVGSESNYGSPSAPLKYSKSFFAAPVGGTLRCVASYRLCLDCNGRGKQGARKCGECNRYGRKWNGPWNGWKYVTGQQIQELGAPLGTLRLRAPEDPEHREEYDS